MEKCSRSLTERKNYVKIVMEKEDLTKKHVHNVKEEEWLKKWLCLDLECINMHNSTAEIVKVKGK